MKGETFNSYPIERATPLEQDHLKQIYNGNLNEQYRYILSLHSTTYQPFWEPLNLKITIRDISMCL